MKPFDARAEVENLKRIQLAARKRTYRSSRLDPFRFEILSLYREGATAAQIRIWLRRKKRIAVVHSTVARWLRRNHAEGRETPEV